MNNSGSKWNVCSGSSIASRRKKRKPSSNAAAVFDNDGRWGHCYQYIFIYNLFSVTINVVFRFVVTILFEEAESAPSSRKDALLVHHPSFAYLNRHLRVCIVLYIKIIVVVAASAAAFIRRIKDILFCDESNEVLVRVALSRQEHVRKHRQGNHTNFHQCDIAQGGAHSRCQEWTREVRNRNQAHLFVCKRHRRPMQSNKVRGSVKYSVFLRTNNITLYIRATSLFLASICTLLAKCRIVLIGQHKVVVIVNKAPVWIRLAFVKAIRS